MHKFISFSLAVSVGKMSTRTQKIFYDNLGNIQSAKVESKSKRNLRVEPLTNFTYTKFHYIVKNGRVMVSNGFRYGCCFDNIESGTNQLSGLGCLSSTSQVVSEETMFIDSWMYIQSHHLNVLKSQL